MNALLQTKNITVETADGASKTYIISKFPAIAGREIVSQYPITGMPKVGDYDSNKEIMLKLMSYVAVDLEAGPLALTSENLINNHVPDWETLAKLEMHMMEYNCSFFGNGKASSFLDGVLASSKELITSMLTDLLQQSSANDKQASKNSKKATPSKKRSTSGK